MKYSVTMERAASETARKSAASFSLSTAGRSPVTEDSDASGVHACGVCGACFETKRGLSSHARSHLRQLGVAVSESSGAPIDLLYRLIQKRDGRLPFCTMVARSPKPKTYSPKKDSGTKLKIKISNLVKKKYSKSPVPVAVRPLSASGISSSLLADVKPLKVPAKLQKVPESCSPLSVSSAPPSLSGSPTASLSLPSSKPLWAPQETDAPLNLTMMDASSRDDVHVCELCGAWYETRKGLSSHARAHLRQFGVEMDSKGAPIEMLHELLQKGDLQGKASTPELHEAHGCGRYSPISTPSTATSSKLDVLPADPETPPPSKKVKMSSSSSSSSSPPLGGLKAQGRGDSLKVVSCEFCHEKFKKSQSLASHARSHLRQLGVTEWTAQGSPMAALRELMARRGSNSLPKLNISHTMPPPSTVPPPTPTTALPPLSPAHLNPSSFPVSTSPRVPKARKGSRTVVPKPKEEPVEVVLSTTECPRPRSTPSPFQTWPGPNTSQITTAPKPEVEATQMVRCDYCSETFDSRKALSCHARAHLRQLGVKWSPNASPIDTLYELMLREGTYQGSEVKPEGSAGMGGSWRKPGSSPRTFTPSPIDFSVREKTDSSDGMSAVCEATCELCGFDFENRKALASHARAHLRQQGVDWRTNGSPIETLSMWMQQEPAKVAELHKRYMQGDLPHVKKRAASSPYPASDPESSRPSVSRLSPSLSLISRAAGREVKAGASQPSFSSSHRKASGQRPASHVSNVPTRLPRGCERRPSKHLSHIESRVGEAGPLKPPRAGNAPSLMPRPPESSLVKLVGKVYSLKCRFCEEVFRGPLSVQEDWLIHLRQHILNLKQDSAHVPTPTSQSASIPSLVLSDTPQLIGPQAV
ncbi:protein Wiz isoform X2 [Electrophorus electricus]|uniref:protein Wiz isoform X2 n=1 Tax=Electrophorus electricus TaxID=8005 RepID=UPI0015CFC016|nr:protein Wiz isoform X2 [Electrophorus electricus]